MYNRARENYQKQISNKNINNNKKYSPIKITFNKEYEQNSKNNNSNKINAIKKDNINMNNHKISHNIILPKIPNKYSLNNKINNINTNIKQTTIKAKMNDKKDKNNSNKINVVNPSKKRSMTGNKIRNPPKVELTPFQRNKKMATVKKRYLKDNNIYTIVSFLDIRTVYFFMLACKQFYKIANECDDVWYRFYIIKFCKPPKEKIHYEIHRGGWKALYLSTSKSIYMKNYDDLKNKFLKK
jgi:hypothetical protein